MMTTHFSVVSTDILCVTVSVAHMCQQPEMSNDNLGTAAALAPVHGIRPPASVDLESNTAENWKLFK